MKFTNTLPAEMFGGSDFWLETRVIIQIWPILDIQEPLTDFHGNEAKKNQNGIAYSQ